MAYAALVSLHQTTDLVLNRHKYSISYDERVQIISIRESTIFLMSFLENFPEKPSLFEGKIRDLANESEDLIEDFMWKESRRCRVELSRGDFEHQLKRLREEIESIIGDIIRDDGLCDLPTAAISSSRVAATGKNDVVIGIDDDLMAIKGRLCGDSYKLEVIPIVGMGGIGKTTLALKAYGDPLIVEHFHIRAFVQFSQDYSAKEILSNLLASIKVFGGQTLGENNESVIAEIVYKSLKGRRYLIIMDDMWSKKAWDDVRNIFPDDKNGSRIMLTTRLSDVAVYVSSGSPLHEMNFMDGNQTWDLLKQKVFIDGRDCPPEWEDMGKAIARGCKGLPLAVVLVAGILSTNFKTRSSWEKMANDVNSVFDGQLDKILSLSYSHLPHHMRPCFLFMAGFPEDHNIHVSRLIKLWVAEGFLKRQNGRKSLEEEAEEYLEDLVARNLVLITQRKGNGKIKSCSLHDLVREMCIRKAWDEKFLLSERYALPNHRRQGRHTRRISICQSCLTATYSPTVRTILCFQTPKISALSCLLSFRLLRVLDIRHVNHALLYSQIFELLHLRYLAIGLTNTFPSGISNLKNLETLIIFSRIRFWVNISSNFSYLPLEIWRMQHLRHLVFPHFYRLHNPASTRLENLQTLSGVPSCVCSKRILKIIPNVKKLGIVCLENQEHHHNFRSLVNLCQLENLKITASCGFSWQGQYPAFPSSLKKLTVVGGKLPLKDMNIAGSLPNLQVLKLKNDACDGDTWETTDGEFSQLKVLLIQGSNLQYWITESSHFPRLKCLVLHNCRLLREIPDSIGDVPTLELISVDNLNESLLKSAKRIQEVQQSYGNDALQLHRLSR